MSELKLGPIVTVTKSCSGCSAERSESYRVQSDSGQDVYCTHPSVGKRRIGDTCWTTPEWCPVELSRLQAGGQGVEPVAWRWMPSQVFPQWIYSDDPSRVQEAKRFMGNGGVQPLYLAPPAAPALPIEPSGLHLTVMQPAAPALVPLTLTEVADVGLVPTMVKPFTPAQRRRLWDNSKEHHKDAANFTGFERIVTLTERAHGINGLTVGDGGANGV